MPIIDRGLDLSRLHEMSPEEQEGFRAFYADKLGGMLPAYELWLENRPDVLKRHRFQAWQTPAEEEPWLPLLFLHYYTVRGYEDGIRYELHNARVNGFTKDQVLETLAVAFIHAGPLGMRYVASAAGEALRDFEARPPRAGLFPPGWEPDPAALASGLDFTAPELTGDEHVLLERWYLDTLGEVPPYVRLLAQLRPGLLKAHRARLETAIRDALPKQMLPLLLLHLAVSADQEHAIRESVLLARAFGVPTVRVVDTIGWGMLYGGTGAVSTVARAVGDLLAAGD